MKKLLAACVEYREVLAQLRACGSARSSNPSPKQIVDRYIAATERLKKEAELVDVQMPRTVAKELRTTLHDAALVARTDRDCLKLATSLRTLADIVDPLASL